MKYIRLEKRHVLEDVHEWDVAHILQGYHGQRSGDVLYDDSWIEICLELGARKLKDGRALRNECPWKARIPCQKKIGDP